MVGTELNYSILVGAAIVDSINPCAFGVLIAMLAYLAKTTNTKAKMIINGLTYIVAVFLTYLAAGLLLLPVIRQLGQVTSMLYIGIAVLIILAGIIEIKDFFWYGRWFSLSIFPSESKRLKNYLKNVSGSVVTAFGLGVFVALVELPCTGAVYIAILTLITLAGFNFDYLTMLVIYNIIFVLPLVVILLAFIKGVKAQRFEQWRLKHRGLMRLSIGLVLIALGVWMLMIAF